MLEFETPRHILEAEEIVNGPVGQGIREPQDTIDHIAEMSFEDRRILEEIALSRMGRIDRVGNHIEDMLDPYGFGMSGSFIQDIGPIGEAPVNITISPDLYTTVMDMYDTQTQYAGYIEFVNSSEDNPGELY